MKWLILATLTLCLSTSHCLDDKRLLIAFDAHPKLHFLALQARNQLPAVTDYQDSLTHVRLYANHGDVDARILLADWYRDNPKLYQATLLSAAQAGERRAQQKLERFFHQTEQWQQLLSASWQVSESLQRDAQMALQLPITNSDHISAVYNTECNEKILLLATDLEGFQAIKGLKLRFDAQFSLNLCLSNPLYLDRTQITCSTHNSERISCDIIDTAFLATLDYSKRVIFSRAGIANASGDTVRMRNKQSEKVLLHELMHLYGFIDEYPLKQTLANRLCDVSQTTQIAKNVIVVPPDKTASETIEYKGQTWFKTHTCDLAQSTAYKPVPVTTNLELLDLPVPELYMAWLKSALQ